MSRCPLTLGLSLLAAFGSIACESPLDPAGPPTCTYVDGTCWLFLGLGEQSITSIAPTQWGLLVGTADRGIFRLEPGYRWTALGPTAWHDHLVVSAMAYLATDPPRVLAGVAPRYDSKDDTTRAAVFASDDGGANWLPSDGGLAENAGNQYRVYADALEVDPHDPARVFMGTHNGVLRSQDAGMRWEFAFGDYDSKWIGWIDILVDPRDSNRIWAAGQSLHPYALVGFSEDGGTTWNGHYMVCSDSPCPGPVYGLALDPELPDRLWAGVLGPIMWADGGGELVGAWDSGMGPENVVGFGELTGVLYAITEQPSLFRFSAAAPQWEELTAPENVAPANAVIADTANGRILIGTRQGLWAVEPG